MFPDQPNHDTVLHYAVQQGEDNPMPAFVHAEGGREGGRERERERLSRPKKTSNFSPKDEEKLQ